MPEAAATWNAFLEYAALTDIGLRRANNQDCHSVVLAGSESEWRQRGHAFIVADGMGAHAAGELASKLACGGVAHTFHKLLDRPAADALRQSVVETNAQIHSRGQANAEFHGMGTTCSVLVLLPGGAIVGHVGDSRVYRLRGQRLEQLTFDHSLVWEMMAAGQIARQGDAASFVPKNIITRSLGPHPEVQVDLEGPYPLEVGDTFLLCSDGLTGQVSDEEIGLVLGALAPDQAAQALIDMANLRGGPDNITVLIIRVKEPVPSVDGLLNSQPGAGLGRRLAAVHPALWVATGVLLLAALAMVAVGHSIAAIACVIGGILAGAIALAQSGENIAGTTASPTIAGPLGAGPHTVRYCIPNNQSLANLAEMAQKLREAAKDGNWVVDWSRFNRHCDEATAAAAADQFPEAVRQYATAISFMMSQLRQQR